MSSVILQGDTLGEKHRHFNKLVEDAIANENYELRKISSNDSDIENLLKIEIASRKKNADYIIEVMKSNDMLYSMTAIKKSTWLITDPQYAHIINPEYLHTQLLPSMNTKIFNKLMLHIRLNLKDETRVETFYEYLTVMKSGDKWLENCSITFIEDVIKNKRLIPLSIFKRLCKKSAHFMIYYNRVEASPYDAKEEILFLLRCHTADVLKILEHDSKTNPSLNRKQTKLLLKKHPQMILDYDSSYANRCDKAEVVRYLNKNEIKSYLCEQVKKEEGYQLCYHDVLKLFLKKIPEEERFEFVKKTFIDKTDLAEFCLRYKNNDFNWYIKPYQWYEFVPTEIALIDLSNRLRVCKDNTPSVRIATLSSLITGAGQNLQHIKSLLTYFRDNFINEPFKFKIQFVDNLLSQISTHNFDVETWNILDKLFNSMDVYIESSNKVQLCLESIIIYKVLHGEPVPKIVEKKIKFKTFVEIRSKLNKVENNKMFTYLFDSVMEKIPRENTMVFNFIESVNQIYNALTLLRDWKRDISEYPYILEKIHHLVKIKQENMWTADMSCLYNVKKSWRKHMFEESLSLCLSEEACLNALKHKPQLLTRHDIEIDTLRTNDAVSLRRLLAKLRVYWPDSLAQHWTDAYLLHLNKPTTAKKAVIKGLFELLPHNQIVQIAEQYIPDDLKINCDGNDQNEITIRKYIAKYLHIARPIIPFDTVLWYAKGDYLHYTAPSLNAILANMSVVASREHLPKLLDGPVSLQKFGLQLATNKLEHREYKSIFLEKWNASHNFSVRAALFKHTYTRITRRAHDPTVQKELWEILSSFIDALTAEESARIYKIFGNVQNVPVSIREVFYTKSYEFLTSLPASANCSNFVKGLIEYAPKIIDRLDEDFVASKMLSPAGTKFCSFESENLEVFACYALCGRSQEDQVLRFKKAVEPAMEAAFQSWDSKNSGQYYVRDNMNKFLSCLLWYCRAYYVTRKTLPIQLFVEITTKMEKELPLLNNYVLYTSWKLVIEYVKIMDEQKSVLSNILDSCKLKFSELDFSYKQMPEEMESVWRDVHIKVSPSLGPAIVKCLKEDTERYRYITTLHSLFSAAFQKMSSEFFSHLSAVEYTDEYQEFILESVQYMLHEDNFDLIYLVVSKVIPKVYTSRMNSFCEVPSEIRTKMESHPSAAVRMQYYHEFRNFSRD